MVKRGLELVVISMLLGCASDPSTPAAQNPSKLEVVQEKPVYAPKEPYVSLEELNAILAQDCRMDKLYDKVYADDLGLHLEKETCPINQESCSRMLEIIPWTSIRKMEVTEDNCIKVESRYGKYVLACLQDKETANKLSGMIADKKRLEKTYRDTKIPDF